LRRHGRSLTLPDMTETVSLRSRLLSRRAAAMLVRNTIVSTTVFLIGLALLKWLVEQQGMDPRIAAAIGFIVSNTLHYVIGRNWIYTGTERAAAQGYVFFLINALIGLVITVGLYAAFLAWTPIDYLASRVIVSVFAGLAMFLLNAVFNFRRL
jgi:putative flippase GtrA